MHARSNQTLEKNKMFFFRTPCFLSCSEPVFNPRKTRDLPIKTSLLRMVFEKPCLIAKTDFLGFGRGWGCFFNKWQGRLWLRGLGHILPLPVDGPASAIGFTRAWALLMCLLCLQSLDCVLKRSSFTVFHLDGANFTTRSWCPAFQFYIRYIALIRAIVSFCVAPRVACLGDVATRNELNVMRCIG